MPPYMSNLLAVCFWPVQKIALLTDQKDSLLSCEDIAQHSYGDYSMAVVQANQLMDGQGQIKSGPFGTFIGVYDGHGGPEASRFINDNLLLHLMRFASEKGGISLDVLRMAFYATEDGFESIVAQTWPTKPQMAAVGSCCLVGVICKGTLYVANVGDSRAVLGSISQPNGIIMASQLSTEHNAGIEAIRQELKACHPDDARIVLLRRGIWCVKGLLQVSRSIGDVYLKKQEFNRAPLVAHFRFSEPLLCPILSAEPAIITHKIQPWDRFIIFASDGLWEHLSNEEAVEIVHNNAHKGAARRLIKAALGQSARKREIQYNDLKRIERGIRRHFHDDITVVVVFIDHKILQQHANVKSIRVTEVSRACSRI